MGVLLADGSEPKPALFDLGSGSNFHESAFWRHYDGKFRRPVAASMRGRCACGWRGTTTYPINWEEVRENGDPDAYDTSGPYTDWAAHLDEVAERAVQLPDDLTGLLKQVHERLNRLMMEDDDALATVLKACDEMEAIIAATGPEAARILDRDQAETLARAAADLGMTQEAARSRLVHYQHLAWR
ncbi:hypothetical protein DWB77_00054 [Streptomyces hundungensis]|uniref:Uncharacterized protein n=1 Tax=Streptomyces hundungensis TaxID=1077946 RepID=A0A387HB01_9ACTN|nr:hypothetical protein DWB77_00054 [Streptomyces hundungensis]